MDCPFCRGAGTQPCASGSACVVCRGERKLPDYLSNEPPCERCNGSGKFPDTLNIQCDVCGGTGTIPLETHDPIAVFNEALDKLWRFPDEEVVYFTDDKRPLPNFLLGAQYLRVVLLDSESGWYEHPNFPGDYIPIGRATEWEWQREAKATQLELR